MDSPRQPPARLVEQVKQVLGDDEEIDHIVVGHVGVNPTWAIALAAFSLALVLVAEVGFASAAVLTIVYLAVALVWVRPSASRVIAATDTGLAVLDASKVRFRPKRVVRRLPPTHRLGPLDGHLFAPIDLGAGERAWVSTGFRATIDAIDGVSRAPDGRQPGLPPKQRLFRLRRDDDQLPPPKRRD